MKLYAAASQWEMMVEDRETGEPIWISQPGSPPYLFAGRYRTKPEAQERLHRVLAEVAVGFDMPQRRKSVLLSGTGPNVARDSQGKRIGFTCRGAVTSGVPSARVLYYVQETEGRCPYDHPSVYVSCWWCKGAGTPTSVFDLRGGKCRYCEGRGRIVLAGPAGYGKGHKDATGHAEPTTG